MTHPDTARLQRAVWRLEDRLKDDDPQADTQTAALLERIDYLAEAGVCQMTTGGKHAFLKDIRAAIAAAKENK